MLIDLVSVTNTHKKIFAGLKELSLTASLISNTKLPSSTSVLTIRLLLILGYRILRHILIALLENSSLMLLASLSFQTSILLLEAMI